MSFPKAKLQRFNDVPNPTPSPAEYHVLTKNHVSGAVISKSERFAELRSPISSDNSFISNGPAPTFRTPNPPRKASNLRKPKPVNLFQSSDDAEALKEKIVECNNKDFFIQELTEHVEELKQELCELQQAVTKLKGQNSNYEITMEKLNEDHKDTLTKLNEKHELQTNALKSKIVEVNRIITVMKQKFDELKNENKQDLNSLLKSIDTLKELIDNLNIHFQALIQQKCEEIAIKDKQFSELEDTLTHTFKQEIDELKGIHQKEIQALESDMLKTVTNMHNIIDNEKQNSEKLVKDLQDLKKNELNIIQKYNEDKLEIIRNFELKIQQMEENHKEATILGDIQLKEKCEAMESGWKAKLNEASDVADAILKECQAIAEYNVIQCEIEKNKVVHELSEERKKVDALEVEIIKIRNEVDYADAKRKGLEIEYSRVIVELNTVRNDLGQEIIEYQENLKQATKDKHLYELTIQKTHETIEALKKRLMKSDRDVEQLKAELEATEESKLQVEGKCIRLLEELAIITELCDVIEDQNRIAIEEAEQKVVTVREELLTKLQLLKMEINALNTSKEDEVKKLKMELQEAKTLLNEQQILNSNAQEWLIMSQHEIERLENEGKMNVNQSKTNELLDENSKLKTVIELMQASENDLLKQVKHLKEQSTECCQHEDRLKKFADLCVTYKELNEKYVQVVEKLDLMEKENTQLHLTINQQEALIGPFRDHLKCYEMEYSALMSEKRDAEQEAHEMGLKYAAILGNQNQKQKIKHLIDLKKKNIELCEEKHKLEIKLRSQARIIEKLKSDSISKKLLKKDKENLDCSNMSENSSRIESPRKERNLTDSPGPLKERNNQSLA